MAGNMLWAHLLRKDAALADTSSQIPPIAPQDKTGTSMRILIHDTQVNLEKFSARLDGLLQRVDDCKAQIVNANKLLDVERDKVLTEMVEIANRCQAGMKAHVGAPAQAHALDVVHVSQVSIDKTMQALEKRIDALQALFQTQAHAMQSIQDQQNSLIGAVLPLVPIVHSVPPGIDQIKTALSDIVTNAVESMTKGIENIRSALVVELAHGHGCTRSLTQTGSSSRHKRSNVSVLSAGDTDISVSSPLDGCKHGRSLKRARIEGTAYGEGEDQPPRRSSRPVVPLRNSGGSPPVLRTPRTPRQPLADLLVPPEGNASRIRPHVVNSTPRKRMRAPESIRDPVGPPTISAATSRINQYDTPSAVDKPTIQLPIVAGPSDEDALSKKIKIEEILEAHFTDVISIQSSPLSSPPSSLRAAAFYNPNDTNETSASKAQSPSQQPLRLHNNMVDVPRAERLAEVLTSSRDASPPKSMSLRDRRAQISRIGRRETRHFIPLVPWSDEEE